MSFYGKVLYEFRKLFSHFKFENASNDNSEIIAPEDVQNGTIEANDNWDTLKFKMGNRWLGVIADDTDGDTTRDNTPDEDSVTLYHMGPGDADPNKRLESIKYIPKDTKVEEEAISQLMPGEHFEIWTTDFDAAGHNTKTQSNKEQVLKLPALEINGVLQTNNNINILTDEDNKCINIGIEKKENENIEISITHTLNGEDADDINDNMKLEGLNGEGYDINNTESKKEWDEDSLVNVKIWQLQEGGLIKVPAIQYDNAGHAKCFEHQYFKLPTQSDENGIAIGKRIDEVEKTIAGIQEELEIISEEGGILSTLESYDSRIKSLEDANFLSVERYETEIGNVNELFIESANYKGVEKTLVGMIGDQLSVSNGIEAMLKEFDEKYEDDTNKLYSIDKSMASMAGMITELIKQNKTWQGQISGVSSQISILQNQIDELKKKHS